MIDAYELGHGSLTVKLGGILPVKRITGADADQGEIQRYLASIAYCPAILVNHARLEWTEVGPHMLRIRDRQDPTEATVNIGLSEEGCPIAVRAARPRIVGKQTVMTPWSGTASDFHEYEGMRVATRLEVAWEFPEGMFTYFRGEFKSLTAMP